MTGPAWEHVELLSRLWFRRSAPARPQVRLLALHGYAENPARLLEAFDRPGFARVDVVAPLGPHQFYNRGGEVVGSWMTRLHRADQIRFLLAGLTRLVEEVDREHGGLPWATFGFSQGAATVHRLRVLSDLPLRHAFAFAGDMPPEVREALRERPPRRLEILGAEDDTRVPADTLRADADAYRAAGWPVEIHAFAGGHAYLPAVLDHVAGRLGAGEV